MVPTCFTNDEFYVGKVMSGFFLLILFFIFTGCALPTSSSPWPKSDHFDGDRFFNRDGSSDKSFGQLLGYLTGGPQTKWPDEVPVTQQKVPHGRVTGDELSITLINHSTTLLQLNGLNILTDPVYGERVSPLSFAGPKRIIKPGVAFEDLPEIDVVLISHNHYDHLDVPTVKRLNALPKPPLILVGLGNGGLLTDVGYTNFKELDWDESVKIGNTEFFFVEAQHWSSRSLFDKRKTLWGGFVIRTPKGQAYFAGDTGYGPFFKRLHQRYGDMRLALLPIGAYEPREFMKFSHMNPEEAVVAHRDLHSKNSVAIHFGTFKLTYEGHEDPPKRLRAALAKDGIAETEFSVLSFGQTLPLKW